MARTITPGRTWRDLPPSPPVGDQPSHEEAPPPPPEPPAPPERRGRGWWVALALALAAALAAGAVWLWADDGDSGDVVGSRDRLGVLDEGDLGDVIPDDLAPLIPPNLLDELGPLFDRRDVPDGFGFFDELPPDLENRLRQFFDEFGGEIPQFDLDDFDLERFLDELPDFDLEFDVDEFFSPGDFFFELGDGSFGLGYLPAGYRVAGSSAGASAEDGELQADITVRLVGPQGPVMIRAEVGGDAAAKLAEAPGEPVEVRGGEGKLSAEGLSFAEDDVFVQISPQGDLPDDELFQIADGMGLGK